MGFRAGDHGLDLGGPVPIEVDIGLVGASPAGFAELFQQVGHGSWTIAAERVHVEGQFPIFDLIGLLGGVGATPLRLCRRLRLRLVLGVLILLLIVVLVINVVFGEGDVLGNRLEV